MAFWDEPAEPQVPLLPQQQQPQLQQPQQAAAPPAEGQGVSWDKVMEAVKPILPSILPMLASGVGAALTSPVKSGPMIAGRALLGGLQGWQEAEKLNANTQKDLYYADRSKLAQARALKLTSEMANKTKYRNTLTDPAEIAEYDADPKAHFARKFADQEKPENLAWFRQRFLKNATPEDEAYLKSLSGKQVFDLYMAGVKHDFEAGEGKTKHGVLMHDVLMPDGTSATLLVDPENNQQIGPARTTVGKGKDKSMTTNDLAAAAIAGDEGAAETLAAAGGTDRFLKELSRAASGLQVTDPGVKKMSPAQAKQTLIDLGRYDVLKGVINQALTGGGGAAPASVPLAGGGGPRLLAKGTVVLDPNGVPHATDNDNTPLPPGWTLK
jgi:hypothetical protein